MADSFDELIADIKHERAENVLRKWGQYIVAAVIALVLVISGYTWYSSNQAEKKMATGEKLFRALYFTDEKDAAQRILNETIATGSAGYKQIARLKKAAELAGAGKQDEANKIYEQVAEDSDADTVFRDLAELMVVHDMIAKKGDGAIIEKKLGELSANGQPWRYSAMEKKAMYEVSRGNKKEALEILSLLTTDQMVPGTIVSRAGKMIEIINE